MSSDGVKTILTHVNRIKPLFETMIWKDEECVDFDDIRLGDWFHEQNSENNAVTESQSKTKQKMCQKHQKPNLPLLKSRRKK